MLIALLLASMMLRRVLRPLRRLSKIVLRRDGAELTPLPSLPWSELQPLIVAFNRYLERLRKLLARQDRFSADAAHQLRTPLTILKTQISTALDSDRPEQWRESLQSMHYTLDDTILLTDRLLQLARIKARHGEDKPMTRVDLAAVVREACLSRYAAARAKQIDLGYEGDEHGEVKGDALLLGELCANLLDNAIKYTPAQGMITARVENGRLQIEDSGPGISREEQQKALRPFIRLDNAAMQAGAGIGLALVQDICAWHGAAVTLESSPLLGGLRVSVNFSADRP